jgi:ABC-type Na+ efflux pump permease subunit
MRFGPGPVFIYECLTNSRRWQTYALRAAGVAALLVAMWTIASSRNAVTVGGSYRDYANLGRSYFFAMIGVELALVMLAAPAATAGAICVDRARGTLAHMLMTDLSDPEIVLGKLAARLLPVLLLVACSWPVMAISSLLGGIDPIALTLAFAIILAVAVLGCSMALALSVWARKSHEVILTTYTVFILGLLLWPTWYFLSTGGRVGQPPQWTLLANPFYVALAPYGDPQKLGLGDYLAFFGVTLGASALLTMLAVWRTRPVACRGAVEKSKGPRIGLVGRIVRGLPGPSLDRNPVLWREWHRSRPSRWMVYLLILLMGTTGVLCVAGAIAIWSNGVDFQPGAIWEEIGVFAYFLHLLFGLLLLSAVAPTSMAEERQRGSLDILATTTLSTRSIVVGKWLGTFRLAVFLLIAPGLMALAMATARSNSPYTYPPGMAPEYYQRIPLGPRIYGVFLVIATILAHGALITSIGVALAVWIKRQGRAIAFSVALFLLITAAWPTFVAMALDDSQNTGRNLASLSPVVVCGGFVNFLTNRIYGFVGGLLECAAFWAVEVLVLAMGLLWLTIRTFDRCFDRIPDRPSKMPVRVVVFLIFAALIGAGSLVGAIAFWIEGIWIEGITVGRMGSGWRFDPLILPYCLALAIGLVLILVVAERSITGGRARRTRRVGETHRDGAPVIGGFHPPYEHAMDPNVSAGRFIGRRWWESFRLVLLLTIGPAVLATAMATTYEPVRLEAKTTVDASGRQETTYVPASKPSPAWAISLGHRLIAVALLIVTILVHGAGAVGLGLALAVARGWSRRVLGVGLGILLLATFILPFNGDRRHAVETAGWSFVVGAELLLEPLVSRGSFLIRDILWTVFFWDVVVGVSAAGLVWWTYRARQRQARGLSEAKAAPETNAEDQEPAVEALLIGD